MSRHKFRIIKYQDMGQDFGFSKEHFENFKIHLLCEVSASVYKGKI